MADEQSNCLPLGPQRRRPSPGDGAPSAFAGWCGPASPAYPGRDPHHWAVYEGATRYGATLHHITRCVDAGPIVAVEWFPVAHGTTPAELLAQANEAAFRLLERVGPEPRARKLDPIGETWTGRKHSRADFLAMCRLDLGISREEFDRRYRAFDGGRYDNLTVELHGRMFRTDKRADGAR